MNNQSNLSEISEKVKNLGVIKKENWLDQEDIKKTKLRLKFLQKNFSMKKLGK